MRWWCYAAVCLVPAVVQAQDQESLLQGMTPQALADVLLPPLGSAMGMPPKHHVTVSEESRSGLRSTLVRIMQRQYPGDVLERMNDAYQLLGLVPSGTRLREAALELYQGQVAGFYDPSNGRMAVLRDGAPMQVAQVLQHELAHALQDQYFSLQKMIDAVVRDEDQALALQAVIEGQAVVAMFSGVSALEQDTSGTTVQGAAAVLREAGLDISDAEVESMVKLDNGTEGQPASLSAFMVPDHPLGTGVGYLQAQLLFPYQEGTRFIESLMRTEGFAHTIARTLTAPPRSTAAVLHPEIYGKRLPTRVRLPHFVAQGVPVFETTVGELNVRTLLGGVGPGDGPAAGWRGDHLASIVLPGARQATVGWLTVWASAAAARVFADALHPILPHDTSGVATLQQRGEQVAIVAGAPAPRHAALLAALLQDME